VKDDDLVSMEAEVGEQTAMTAHLVQSKPLERAKPTTGTS
jgi:hypothetical protein